MVYDCFPFFNELDLLEIRLNVLNSSVDKFVIVEADRTHSGGQKPFFFEENKGRFGPFLDKIIYIKLTEYPILTTNWILENYQRNMITEGLKNCNADDVVLISDLDEIPNPNAIKMYAKISNRKGGGGGILKLQQHIHFYFINYRSIIQKYWYGTRIMRYSDILQDVTKYHEYSYNEYLIESLNQGSTPTKIRMIKDFPILKNGGWHFTYLGGLEAIKTKIRSFSHQEFNNEQFLNDEALNKKIARGIDLFNPKDYRYLPVKIKSPYFPEYLVNNQDKYSELFYSDINTVRNIYVFLEAYIIYFTHILYRNTKKFVKIIIKLFFKGKQKVSILL
jgi:beta-1,4-mannosyl-glycoprotein beta-1,4-N-acetylglucosaminyltransferase